MQCTRKDPLCLCVEPKLNQPIFLRGHHTTLPKDSNSIESTIHNLKKFILFRQPNFTARLYHTCLSTVWSHIDLNNDLNSCHPFNQFCLLLTSGFLSGILKHQSSSSSHFTIFYRISLTFIFTTHGQQLPLTGSSYLLLHFYNPWTTKLIFTTFIYNKKYKPKRQKQLLSFLA